MIIVEKPSEKVKELETDIDNKERRILFFSSWTLGLFVLGLLLVIIFFCRVELCNIISEPYTFYLMLLLGIFLFLFPFIRRLKIGKFFEIEKDLERAREEIKDFKQEIRHTVNVMSNLSNVMNVFNIPTGELNEVIKVKQNVIKSSTAAFIKKSEDIKDQLSLKNKEDLNLSLARTRMRLEYLLRLILNKIKIRKDIKKDIKYMPIRRLLEIFLKNYPDYNHLRPGFDYVIRVANAAIHAQRVPEGQATEALDLGARLIALLEKAAKDEGLDFS